MNEFDLWFKKAAPWALNFSPGELTKFASNSRNGVMNGMPPQELWPNVLPTLYLLQQLRHKLDRPIRITSAFRRLEYNRQLKSPDNSQHVFFRALDFQADGVNPQTIKGILLSWRSAGAWTGGLGTYPTFNHIDTRPSDSTWDEPK